MFGSEPGTTPAPNEPATALQRVRAAPLILSRAASYLRATPRLRRLFSTDQSRTPSYQPGTLSRSQVSSRLHRVGHVASGFYATGPAPDVPCSRTVIVYAGFVRRFQRTEEGSVLLPIGTGFSQFGTVSHTTYRQAVTRLSWLSSSRPPDLPKVPDSGPESVPPVTRLGAPHAGRG